MRCTHRTWKQVISHSPPSCGNVRSRRTAASLMSRESSFRMFSVRVLPTTPPLSSFLPLMLTTVFPTTRQQERPDVPTANHDSGNAISAQPRGNTGKLRGNRPLAQPCRPICRKQAAETTTRFPKRRHTTCPSNHDVCLSLADHEIRG
jgi:hypothetical protein